MCELTAEFPHVARRGARMLTLSQRFLPEPWAAPWQPAPHLDPAVSAVYVLEADLQLAVGFLDQVLHLLQEQVIVLHAEKVRERGRPGGRVRGDEGWATEVARAAGTWRLCQAGEATPVFSHLCKGRWTQGPSKHSHTWCLPRS